MAKPSDIQQARSKKRIKQLIETRPVGRSVRKEKLRIGRLVGYTGKEASIIRSVNRLITPQKSKQTRNLRSKKQIRKIDRSWRDRIKGEKGRDFQISITEWVKPIILKSDFKDDDFDVWLPGAIQGIGQIVFSKPRGIIRGYYLRFTNDDDFERGEPIHSLGFQLPLGSTFGYLENGMKDLYNIWNKRIRLLFENQSYPITKAIFSPFVPEAIELINNEVEKVVELPGLEMGYYINYQIEQTRRERENA